MRRGRVGPDSGTHARPLVAAAGRTDFKPLGLELGEQGCRPLP